MCDGFVIRGGRAKWPVHLSAGRSLWRGIHTHQHTHKLLYKDTEERRLKTVKTNGKGKNKRGKPLMSTLSHTKQKGSKVRTNP